MLDFHTLMAAGEPLRVAVDDDPDGGERGGLWPTIGEYPVYDAPWYRTLTSDETRNERFRAALRKLAPGRTVLDIGTGRHVNWARESIRCGARHALAMEEIADSYHKAVENLREWGLTEDITLLKGSSSKLTTGSEADVCVAEIIGSVAGSEGAAAVLADAKRRHMKPGGTIIPDRCVTHASAVCLRDALGGKPVAFSPHALPYLAKIFDSNGGPFDVRLRLAEPNPDCLMSTTEPIEVLAFNENLLVTQENRVTLDITRPGRIDGLLTWLALSCLADETPIDALRDTTSWAAIYFPLFPEEVAVREGDRLEVTARTTLSDDGVHPDYDFDAVLHTSGEAPGEATGETGRKRVAHHSSRHHGGPFRSHPVYRTLFPNH